MEYLKKYQKWLNSEHIDVHTKEELLIIQDDEGEIKERFYCELEFGTGGLRGIIGAGTNRMNIYSVRKATQGIANYIQQQGAEAVARGVVIAYDSRHFSPEFAEATALTLNANGIKTYLFDQPTATPILSFAIRQLKTIAGVVITASHNPAEYNGYKLYWEDGGQVVPKMATQMICEVQKICDFDQIKTISRATAEKAGLFNIVSENLFTEFIESIKLLSLLDDSFHHAVANLKVIYTPLHGTGNQPIRRVLQELGFKQLTVIEEQELPDPNFSTVKTPNPEDKEAFTLAIKMAKRKQADLIIGTDPDCDRIGVVEQTDDGEYTVLTGNQIGVLLAEYILSRRQELNLLPTKGAIIKTVVTTDMVKKICANYGVAVFDTLTGFKFIGEKIKEFKETGEFEFLLGFEESYGYLIGTHARDKDAVVAAAQICEMAAYYKSRGISLYNQLLKLMDEYGYYLEDLRSLKFPGCAGQEKIQQMMKALRESKPELIGLRQVKVIEDYLAQERFDLQKNLQTRIDLPESNVLKFIFLDQSSFTIRPSGTEPKIKIYFSVVGANMEDGQKRLAELTVDVLNLLQT